MPSSGKGRIREWWIKALLGQQTSAHPLFGSDIDVEVAGDLVLLTGTVKSADEVQEIERELRGIERARTIVNHLTVMGDEDRPAVQTVVAIFESGDAARLGCQMVRSWKLHSDTGPIILESPSEARNCLTKFAQRAQVPIEAIQRYVDAVEAEKALLVDRVPEGEAVRVVSALEGTQAEIVQTLPPEST